jgi:hypothetical protein
MSGTRRTRISRQQHAPFSAEALRLFAELERDRPHPKVYNDREHELARLLNLVGEWWGGNSVCDNADGPDCPPHLARYQNWFKVRRVREALLEAAAKMQPAPAK